MFITGLKYHSRSVMGNPLPLHYSNLQARNFVVFIDINDDKNSELYDLTGSWLQQ